MFLSSSLWVWTGLAVSQVSEYSREVENLLNYRLKKKYIYQFIILIIIIDSDKKNKQNGHFSTTKEKSSHQGQILDISQSSALYKVFIPAKANMLLLGGKACTTKYNSHTQYCTSILGHHRGVQPFSLTERGQKQLHHWLIVGQKEPVSSVLFTHPTTIQTLSC